MKNRLAIFGASGHGKAVACAAECAGWKNILFFDDTWPRIEQNSIWPVTGNFDALLASINEFDGIIVAIGNNAIRHEKLLELMAVNAPLTSIIHPSACISRYSGVGIGSVVLAGCVINANAQIGSAAIINTAATVDHDCVLGDAVHLSPGVNLGGNVHIGDLSWIGIGSCVRHGINIGRHVMVGAGAAVVSDIPDKSVVAGVPATPLRKEKTV